MSTATSPSDRKLLRIPLSAIRENPVALRSVNRQTAEYKEFADSIRINGVLNPIVVREIESPDGTQLYGIIEGLHRYTGSLDAGHTDIPAQVINMADAQVLEAQVIGNIHKIETKPVEYSKQLQRMLASNPLLTMSQLAGKLNKSDAWLSERLGILKLTKDIAALVDEGKINLSNAYALAKLPEDEQQAFVDRAMSMSPAEFTPTVLARKRELDQAKRQGRDAGAGEFTPVAHLQKLSDLKAEMTNQSVGPALCKLVGATTPEDGFAIAVKWVLHLDPNSVAVAKEKDDVRKRELEAQRAKAAAERAKKRATEAAEAAAKLQQSQPA
jgi:ParB/RepB/Spo0J family partition protein